MTTAQEARQAQARVAEAAANRGSVSTFRRVVRALTPWRPHEDHKDSRNFGRVNASDPSSGV